MKQELQENIDYYYEYLIIDYALIDHKWLMKVIIEKYLYEGLNIRNALEKICSIVMTCNKIVDDIKFEIEKTTNGIVVTAAAHTWIKTRIIQSVVENPTDVKKSTDETLKLTYYKIIFNNILFEDDIDDETEYIISSKHIQGDASSLLALYAEYQTMMPDGPENSGDVNLDCPNMARILSERSSSCFYGTCLNPSLDNCESIWKELTRLKADPDGGSLLKKMTRKIWRSNGGGKKLHKHLLKKSRSRRLRRRSRRRRRRRHHRSRRRMRPQFQQHVHVR